ncbi:hypothetical protein [Marinobacter sp. Hex_13]|uniref:hypothetical protein n=1 Tax=Marinobacter sp. Hex_13 TaxID=1795866 RepID=UPI00257E1A34|nr:hypothetical protein [Marinobacter sp. Hex_13]
MDMLHLPKALPVAFSVTQAMMAWYWHSMAPWGSGKSTVLNYVRHFLEQLPDDIGAFDG